MKIAFLCGVANPGYPWADPSYEQGIGGAEECVILLTRELAKLGHEVTVYNYCANLRGVYHGVRWENYDRPGTRYEGEYDLYVSWRQPHLLQGITGSLRWLWDHNNPIGAHVPTKEQLPFIDRMVFLNGWHLEQYVAAGVPREKCWVGGTAADSSRFEVNPVPERIPYRVIAFYHPRRGLDVLYRLWPPIRAQVPEATLAAFWWQEEFFLPPNESLGILPMRHLGPQEMAMEILQSEVFAYPATGTETAPLTVIKAQMGGAIPVVVPVGGMSETLHYGIQTTHDGFSYRLAELLWRSGQEPREPFEAERQKMMRETRKRYSWKEVAKRWDEQLNGFFNFE